MAETLEKEPTVGKPGAGLPFFEWFLAKYILLPGAYRKTGNEEARRFFQAETDKILALVNGIDAEKLTTRALIPRLRGLEDNSRYWSVAMVLEHLAIVGGGIKEAVIDLTRGGTDKKPVTIKDVKPDSKTPPEQCIQSFKAMSESFLLQIDPGALDNHPEATYPHPWFGPMTARQWYILAGRHQAIHRHQIEQILSRL
ncbi:MAG TPA: DinB family protein [Candidatus Melainabacteria bacterium]|nr:DinB family protein [Candidatus Melainabacteria bacterium]